MLNYQRVSTLLALLEFGKKTGFGTVRFRSSYTNPKDWDYPPGFFLNWKCDGRYGKPMVLRKLLYFHVLFFIHDSSTAVNIVIKLLCIFRLRYLVGKQLQFVVDRARTHILLWLFLFWLSYSPPKLGLMRMNSPTTPLPVSGPMELFSQVSFDVFCARWCRCSYVCWFINHSNYLYT